MRDGAVAVRDVGTDVDLAIDKSDHDHATRSAGFGEHRAGSEGTGDQIYRR